MRFDIDMNSKQAELFLDVRKLVMDELGDEVQEKYSENITTYKTKEGGYCYLRTKDDYVHIGWFRGAFIDDKYGFLSGNGKTIRAHKIKNLSQENIESIKYYIKQTHLYLLEHNELMKMKKVLKDKYEDIIN